MIRSLIEKAVSLPEKIENLVGEIAETKQSVHELTERKRLMEAEVAGEVASENGDDGRRRYPNEEARKAEIVRRLTENQEYQNICNEINQKRERLASLEAELEKNRYEHRTATTLLNLYASALTAGRPDIEQMISTPNLQEETPQEPAQEQPAQETTQNAEQDQGSELLEALITVLEARRTERGTIRAWCQTENGDRVVVFAKNSNGEKLERAAGSQRTLRIKYRVLDAGWYAVRVATGRRAS